MSKVIYKVDFDYIRTSTSILYETFIVDESYQDEDTGENHKVISIEEVFSYGERTIVVYFDDGIELEIFDIFHTYKKLLLN